MANRFNDDPKYQNSVQVTPPVASDDTAELVDYALRIYKPGYRYQKAGVILLNLVPLTLVQPSLFDQRDREKYRLLMATIGLNQSAARDRGNSVRGNGDTKALANTSYSAESPIYDAVGGVAGGEGVRGLVGEGSKFDHNSYNIFPIGLIADSSISLQRLELLPPRIIFIRAYAL